MYRLICPQVVADSLTEIDFEKLKALGIQGIIFDLDNTLVPWGSSEVSEIVSEWLLEVLKRGFQVAIVSNNWHSRVKRFANQFDIPFVSRAYKPAKVGIRRALSTLGLRPAQTALVGDQLFTDILGGNRLGLYTIWVKPLSEKEFVGTKIQRWLERIAVRVMKEKGLLK